MEFRQLRADEIEVRVGRNTKRGVALLLYKDARADMRILDETVGPENWQRAHKVIDGNLYCNVGIWADRRGDGYGDWVWKQDVGTESNTEKEKGEASDAFKRACFNWGIGRELYTGPFLFFKTGEFKEEDGKCVDKFKATNIQYENGRIKSVTIMATKAKVEKVFNQDVSEIPLSETPIDNPQEYITEADAAVLDEMIRNAGHKPASYCKYLGIKTWSECTQEMRLQILEDLEKRKEATDANAV